MVNGKYEPLQDSETSVFLCETIHFEVSGLRDRDLDSKMALQKIQDWEMFRTTQKTRLRDLWNFTKILRDLYIFRGQFLHPLSCQRIKNLMSNSPVLADFSVGLVGFILHLPDGQVKVLGEIFFAENSWKYTSKNFFGLVKTVHH